MPYYPPPASSSGVADGDKGDITVSNSGATWTIDSGVVTEAKQVIADNTTNDVTTSAHGYVPKAPNLTHQWLRGDGTWAARNMTILTLASDKPTGADVNPITLTDLVFTYAASSTYLIQIYGLVSPTANTTGCGFQFDLSSAVTRIASLFFHQLANTGTVSGGHSVADDASVGVSSGMPGTGSYPVVLNAILVTGANTGTCQARFRSETTAVTTCKAGTVMIVEKIA
jgi:hypothetical protein